MRTDFTARNWAYRTEETDEMKDITQFSEDTLKKVYDAIEGCGYTRPEATDMVTAMQGAGILFRERVS